MQVSLGYCRKKKRVKGEEKIRRERSKEKRRGVIRRKRPGNVGFINDIAGP